MIFGMNQREILENLAILNRVQEDIASIKHREWRQVRMQQNEGKGNN